MDAVRGGPSSPRTGSKPPVKTMSALSISSCSRSSRCSGANLNFASSSIASKTVTSASRCAREGQHHRRVIPGDQRTADRGDMRVEQAAQRGFARILGHACGKMRDDDADIRRVLGLADLEEGGFRWRRSRPALPSRSHSCRARSGSSDAAAAGTRSSTASAKSRSRLWAADPVPKARHQTQQAPRRASAFSVYPPCCELPVIERAERRLRFRNRLQINTELMRLCTATFAGPPD